MKSTNSHNGSEEVIELLSQNVITHDDLEDDNVGFIKAEVTSVLTDTSEIANTTTQQDSDDLPEILRNMSWHDPFYESSNDRNDIIMAFDIDRTKYDRFIVPRILGICGTIILISVCLQLWDLLVFKFVWITVLVTVAVSISVACITVACIIDCVQRSNQYRAKRAHIALTSNGIYIDKVDIPGGHNHMMRSVILYKHIRECNAKREYNCLSNSTNYKVEILTYPYGMPFWEPYSIDCIDDLARPQQFVDAVKAMMERSKNPTTRVHCNTCKLPYFQW